MLHSFTLLLTLRLFNKGFQGTEKRCGCYYAVLLGVTLSARGVTLRAVLPLFEILLNPL